MIHGLQRPDDGRLVVVVGPTASGKTELAIALAEAWNGEVLSADSVQIYRGFDVGSGKPTQGERARAPHHLIDVCAPDDPIDAARFVALAEETLAEVRARGRTPIVCGGTYLWVKALVRGLAPLPPKDTTLRARHDAIVRADGRVALHARLAAVDPASAQRLAPNDVLRVSRALEIYELTGRPQSDHFAEHGFRTARHATLLLGVERDREELDRRITERVRAWLQGGWLDEVRSLCAAGYGETRAMGSVGYKQVREHLLGELPLADLEGAIVRATRVFVRRQRTWLRNEPVTWLSP